MIVVTESNGDSTFWDGVDLRLRIDFACIGLDLNLTATEIESELRRSLYPEMKREDLNKTIILNAKAMIERDADFARFAGRILLSFIYEEVLGWNIITDGVDQLRELHRRGFKAYLKHAIKIERLNPELLHYDLTQIADALDPSADLDFDYLGVQTLYDRYLIVDKTDKVQRRLEVPQYFWMRVAMGLFIQQPAKKEQHAIDLYNLYKSRRFCSSTPTLFNAGTLHSQLSSCYLYKVDDSIESIMHCGIADNAFLPNGPVAWVVPDCRSRNWRFYQGNQRGKPRVVHLSSCTMTN